jgi:exodeoxyribonuclease V alpha subunit
LLEWQPRGGTFARDEYTPLDVDAVIVDEVSMVDLPLFEHLVRALPEHCRLILVGDVDQLPSVGPGAVLHDVISSDVVPVTALTQIYRQAEGSLIIENAHRILRGQMPIVPESNEELTDFYWIERQTPEAILDAIGKVLTQRIPSAFQMDPVRDVQVVTPMHRGPLGTEALNVMIKNLLNPADGNTAGRFTPGDKVMQLRNNYEKEVFNGDVGFVEKTSADGKLVIVRFDEPHARLVVYEAAALEELTMAWATSIHKSQGSEYPAIIIPLHTQHYMMLRRNLIYTAVTRGRRLVVMVGTRKALNMALRASTVVQRYGQLADRLREAAR